MEIEAKTEVEECKNLLRKEMKENEKIKIMERKEIEKLVFNKILSKKRKFRKLLEIDVELVNFFENELNMKKRNYITTNKSKNRRLREKIEQESTLILGHLDNSTKAKKFFKSAVRGMTKSSDQEYRAKYLSTPNLISKPFINEKILEKIKNSDITLFEEGEVISLFFIFHSHFLILFLFLIFVLFFLLFFHF